MDYALVDQASEQFLGQWRRLVSTTNWEKGRIIQEWREALREAEAPPSESSDDAWSRHVGNVTPQHVGRLRRVFERFAAARDDYSGLFWSHFQAALDWDDAEMWLEGAVQNGWSIADMRRERNEALGISASDETTDAANLSEPWDEDAEPPDVADVAASTTEVIRAAEQVDEDGEMGEGEEGYDRSEFDDGAGERHAEQESLDALEAVRPFAQLPPLPADLSDAFESYKLCILRDKLAGWQEISRDDMLVSLDSLRQLALAPA